MTEQHLNTERHPLTSDTYIAECRDVLNARGALILEQLVPPQTGTIELTSGDEVRTAQADDMGRFTFQEVPEGPIRLSCRLDASGQVVQTNWLML